MGKSCEGTGIEELIRVIDRCGVGVAFTEGVLGEPVLILRVIG